MKTILLETKHLSKRFCKDPRLAVRYTIQDIFWEFRRQAQGNNRLRQSEFWSVKDVNLQLRAGEVVGVIGHNGAGKSTLINLITGVLRPTLGQVIWYTNHVVMIDNSGGLNSFQTGRENIYNRLSMYGVSEQKIKEKIDSIIDYSGIHTFIDAPVGTYSTGMRLRLAFSIYTQLKPDVFIIDEALGGGDIVFRQKFQIYLREYIANGGAILLISHEIYAIRALCHRLILLDQGEIYDSGEVDEVIHTYNELMEKRESYIKEQESLSPTVQINDVSENINEDLLIEEKLGLIKIEQVEVIPMNGEEIFPGSKVQIQMICHSQIDNYQIIINFSLGKDGLFPMTMITGNYGDQCYQIRRGENKFLCTINQLPLLPGKYQLKVTVLEHDSLDLLALKGYSDQPFCFEVKGLANLEMNLSRSYKCLFYIPVEWE
ncbi:ABC transporter ATP-binding protein [Nostoc sp.]